MKIITLFHFQWVLQNAKQFWSLKRPHHYGIFMGCHHGTGRAQCWHLAVTCNITVAIVKTIEICGVFVISDNTKLILGLCNMNEWWRWHRLHTVACFGRNFLWHVTYLPISPKGRPRFEHSYRVNLPQPVEFKIVRTEKWLRTKHPSRTCPMKSHGSKLCAPSWYEDKWHLLCNNR